MARVHGAVAEGFEGVLERFAAAAAAEEEPGARLTACVHGRRVVDLWAGEGVSGDSLHALYSSGKGAAYVVVALLVQDGRIDLDRPYSVSPG